MSVPSPARRSILSTICAFALLLAMLLGAFPGAYAQSTTPVGSPVSMEPTGPSPPAWLEFGPDGRLIARVIVSGACPPLLIDGLKATMAPRTAPSDAFPVVACEATVPFGIDEAAIAGQPLPIPDAPYARIAVIGDTGCRLDAWEGGSAYQACNDPTAWPFSQVAASVAAWRPDLVIHVGDYLYREDPCPASDLGCAGSPHGDNWETWNADFFTPASSLLGAAPWVFMRGNHEMCGRNPEGWFAYLDTRAFQSTCQQFTEPYVATLNGLSLAVIDSAEAGDEVTTPEENAQYARQFDLLARLAPAGSWLVTHRPVHGILESSRGEFEVENASYQAATGGTIPGDYALVLSGHIHLAESIAFEPSSDRPLQLISGNSGTALDDIPTASPSAGQLGDPTVAEAETLSAFGFMTLEPDGANWIATRRDATGTPLQACVLDLPEMACSPAQAD
ncbi:MAG: metallophosphoesterase family protein [Thermomicrobiales bacterium]